MKTRKTRLAAAALALLLAGCAVDLEQRITAPEKANATHVVRIDLSCPWQLQVGEYGYCRAEAYDMYGRRVYGEREWWWSSNSWVASVNSYGDVYGNSPGAAWIYVEIDGRTQYAYIDVFEPTPTTLPGLSLSISGPTSIHTAGSHTWYAQASNRLNGESVAYTWEVSTDGGWSWSEVGTGGSYTRGVSSGDPSFQLRLTGTSSLSRDPNPSSTTVSVSVANPLASLSVSIDGPTWAPPGTYCGYTAFVSGGTAPYSYSWSVAHDSFSYPGQPEVLYVNAYTSFSISLTVTDANGEQATASHSVHVNRWASECGG